MKQNISITLQRILADTARETAQARNRRSLKRIKQMTKDAPPVLPFGERLAGGNCLIAEIKERSPSQGKMLSENFQLAPEVYKNSPFVKAVSVLTNKTYFGASMTVERMLKVKEFCGKPVIRKDFITEAYQIYEARAFGVDAILLMANILDRNQLRDLSDIAFDLGMDVLFETHSAEELSELPASATVVGINCRNFNSNPAGFKLAKFWRQWVLGGNNDRTTNTARFDYASQISDNVVKIAESGVTPDNCADVFSKGFHAVLVGTSLLMDTRGIHAALNDFEKVLAAIKAESKHSDARQPAPEFA